MTDQQARWIVQTLVPRILADEGRGFMIACIGGWAELLGPVGKTAEEILGLTRRQADVLFYGVPPSSFWHPEHRWPQPYYREYCAAKTPSKQAAVAARLLTRVARTRGRCLRVRRRTVKESRQ